MASSCQPNSGASLQQLFQPFVWSKLEVKRYDISAWGDDDRDELVALWRADFDALWSAWDRPTAEVVTYNLSGSDVLPYFIEKMLREPKHGDRHYTVNGDSLGIIENYMD
ncbi:hypothetical protein AAVH_16086, partial [Aphelenchoides avenae]